MILYLVIGLAVAATLFLFLEALNALRNHDRRDH